MNFITQEDFKIVVGEAAFNVITQASLENRNNAVREAQEEISSYLRPKYDCKAIFEAKDNQRNSQIVMIACDIALYHMVSSQPSKMGAEIRKERYDRAIQWLAGVQAGKIIPALPLVTNESGEPTAILFSLSSQTKQRNNW